MSYGKFGGGDGTEASPYLIEDAYDLFQIRFYADRHFKLTRHIDLAQMKLGERGWMPIPEFSGTLNGGHKKILNLRIHRPDIDRVGLFGKINSAGAVPGRVYDLVIEQADVTGREYVGILAGLYTNSYGSASQTDLARTACKELYVSGSAAGRSNVGGLFGALAHANAANINWLVLKNCFFAVTVESTHAECKAGGVIGSLYNLNAANNALATPRLTFANLISTNTFAGETNRRKVFFYEETSNALTLDHCIYQQSRAGNAAPNTGALGYTDEEMVRQELFDSFELETDGAGGSLWKFFFQKVPQFSFMTNDLYLIYAGKTYLYYDETERKWQEIGAELPPVAVIEANCRFDLNQLDIAAWLELKKKYPTVEIVDIIEKSIGVDLTRTELAMARDAAHSFEHKHVYRMPVDLSALVAGKGCDGIFQIADEIYSGLYE